MEVKRIAEACFRVYSGGDPVADSGLELEDFEDAIQAARAWKIKIDFLNSGKEEGERYINEAWLKTYESETVLFNETNQVYYTVLPSKVLGLPQGIGLYFVSRTQNLSDPFAKMTTNDMFLMSDLFNLKVDNKIYYRQDMDNIYYIAFNPAIKNVFIQLVPLEDDEIPDEFAFEIRDIVLDQMLKPKLQGVMEDKLDNTNPNKAEMR